MKPNIRSSHSTLFWLSVLILTFTISGFVSDLAPEELSLSFDESFVIGGNTDADANYFLASPYQIRTDNRQNIYIAEGQQKTIMVFGPQGNYLRSIGRSGKGPGEFPSGPIFNLNNENNIVAYDIVSKRITWFSKKVKSYQNSPLYGQTWCGRKNSFRLRVATTSCLKSPDL